MEYYNFTPLAEPIAISEQKWPEGTNPLVSTATLTYNHEPYIRACLDGILMQKTTFPVRVTIFEDASTDRTAEIVKEYADKYPGLIFAFCQKENTYGKGEIRQKALQPYFEARSVAKYIALCEGDDYWTDPLKLQKQVEFLEGNPEFSMCFHNAMLKYENNPSKNRKFTELETREYSGDEILRKWTIPTASVVYRTSMYEPVSHPDFIFGDIVLFLSLSQKGRIYGLNENMSVYRKHDGGVTKANKKNIFEFKKKYIKHISAIKITFNGELEETCNEMLAERHIDLARFQIYRFDKEFLNSLKKSYKLNSKSFLKNLFNVKKIVRSLIVQFTN